MARDAAADRRSLRFRRSARTRPSRPGRSPPPTRPNRLRALRAPNRATRRQHHGKQEDHDVSARGAHRWPSRPPAGYRPPHRDPERGIHAGAGEGRRRSRPSASQWRCRRAPDVARARSRRFRRRHPARRFRGRAPGLRLLLRAAARRQGDGVAAFRAYRAAVPNPRPDGPRRAGIDQLLAHFFEQRESLEGMRTYAIVAVDGTDPSPAREHLLSLARTCTETGLFWGGGVAIGGSRAVVRFAGEPRMGIARRRLSEPSGAASP